MTRIRFSEPPDAPDGVPWCTFCLMLAKSQINAQRKDELEKLANDDNPKAVHWVPWDTTIALLPGRYRGLSDITALGVIDVCFTHLAGLKLQTMTPLLQASGDMPPGLIRGRG